MENHTFTKKTKNFSELFIACKFMPKKQLRYALNYLNVTEDEIQSTDGRRAIRVKNINGIAAGRYRVAKCTKSLIEICPVESTGNYPKFSEVFPNKTDGENFIIDDKADTPSRVTSLLLYHLAQVKVCIDIDLFKPVADIGANFEVWATKGEQPVYFKNDNADMVIMPLTV